MNTESLQNWLGQIDQSQGSLRRNLGQDALGAGLGSGAEGVGVAQSTGFGDVVQKATQAVHKPASAAMQAVRSFARGGEGEMHETMMAVKKGEISFKYMVALKNKAIEAYKEVMRMG